MLIIIKAFKKQLLFKKQQEKITRGENPNGKYYFNAFELNYPLRNLLGSTSFG